MQLQIAENIKRFRIAQGFTQGDLAVLLSVSAQAVSRWENGQAFPDITLLPLLAKYLNVSIDELMGQEKQQYKRLEKELYQRRQAKISDESENLQNELRILDIYEELGQTEDFYLRDYFRELMLVKNNEKLNIKGLDERIVNARKMIRSRMKTLDFRGRISMLSTVSSCEDEDKLELWADEYELPEYIKANFWDELILSRYITEKNIEKANSQNQKILYKHIKDTLFCLNDSLPRDMKEQGKEFYNLERYKTALDTLSLCSTRVDDIFIFDRIVAEERYAEALLYNGRVEECLDIFSQVKEHLFLLYNIPEESVLCGSVSFLDKVRLVICTDDKLTKCLMNIGGYDRNPLYDQIRADKRFSEFAEALKKFFPQQECRSWVNEKGENHIDDKWEILLNRAKKEIADLSDGEVVVMLTSKGTVISVFFEDLNSAIDPDGIMRSLLEIKKNGDAKIERMVCMWHNGGVDLPSFAFREALLTVDSTNFSSEMLLNGLTGYIVKTVMVTMPKGYEA